MRKRTWLIASAWLVGAPLMGLLDAFVLTILWGWFAVEALSLPPISVWYMFGLPLRVTNFTAPDQWVTLLQWRWRQARSALIELAPVERRETIALELGSGDEDLKWLMSNQFFGGITRALKTEAS